MNLTFEVLASFVGSFVCLLSFYVARKNSQKSNVKHFIYFEFFTLNMFLFLLLIGLSEYILSIELAKIAYHFYFFSLFGIVFFLDYISSDRINIIRMGFLIFFVSISYFYMLHDPISLEIKNEYEYPSIVQGGIFFYSFTTTMSYICIYYFIWTILTYNRSAETMRKLSRYLVLGGFILGPIMIITRIPVIYALVPIAVPIFSVGILITSLIFLRDPRILLVLPFKPHRITALHKESGIPLFEYLWTEQNIDDLIFSGLIKAVHTVSNEVLDQGVLKEIKLDNGSVIIVEFEDLIVALYSSKSSRTMHINLQNFAEEFMKQNCECIKNDPNTCEAFIMGYEILEKYFILN